MDTPREVSTNDEIILRTSVEDTDSWQRTFEQIQCADDALADILKPAPYDWEAEGVF